MLLLSKMGLISFEILVLIAALYLYVYISKQGMSKVYRYFVGTIAVAMIVIVAMTAMHSRHYAGHGCGGSYKCIGHGAHGDVCGHYGGEYGDKDSKGYGHHRKEGGHHGTKRIEKRVTIDEDGHKKVEIDVNENGEKKTPL